MEDERLAYLFNRFVNKSATIEEKDELMYLLNDAGNDDKVRQMIATTWNQMKDDEDLFNDEEKRQILSEILGSSRLPIYAKKGKFISRVPFIAAAAIVVVLIGVGMLWFKLNPKAEPGPTLAAGRVLDDKIVPGGEKAILTLADGSHILLDTAANGNVRADGNIDIVKLDGQVLYRQNSNASLNGTTGYNTIATPVGGQYQVVLPDGTVVWLNAASAIRFPLSFPGKTREVTIAGEAFFEVKKNPLQPFIVRTSEGVNVRVLGTSFNVMAYEDESSLVTTLIEGKVAIENGKVETNLLPSEKVVFDKQNARFSKSETDVHEAIAWKEGRFYFSNEDIFSIMRKLARWYNIDVQYAGHSIQDHYTGTIKRQADISKVFEMLEVPGGIKFTVDGRKVIVSPK